MQNVINSYSAKWTTPLENGAVQCRLCPRQCRIAPGKSGYCAVRKNLNGTLIAETYGHPVAIQNDPIEKKPLYHFLPGTRTFSIGTFGCNLGCLFCQNDGLSRGAYDPKKNVAFYPPDVLADAALAHGCHSIAFTYNEPTVWAEYMIDIAREAKKRGLATVLVSNGFISQEAREELYPLIDAANIDVKGFSEEFYQTMCGGSLEPVKQTCEYFKNVRQGHLELTELVIPGKNDSDEMTIQYLDWVKQKLGLDTVLHFTAYFPAYKYNESPPTPPALLHRMAKLAENYGFQYVHLGNI